MSRREPGPGRQGRHARDRLEATLGGPVRPLLDGGDGQEPFQSRAPEDGPRGRGQDAATPGKRLTTEQGEPGARTDPMHVRLRWRVGLRVSLLLAVLALGAAAWFWFMAASGRPEVLPLSDADSGPPVTHSSGTGTPDGVPYAADAEGEPAGESDGRVVVHVAGAVAKPGVVQLPPGSRVHQAITAVGGAAAGADLNRLNLALVLADGQKILVPREGDARHPDPTAAAPEGAAPGVEGSSAGGADSPKVNLNSATLEELDALPKVGPVLAQRILDWRKDHGSFKSIEDLDAVDGVGPKMLEALLPLVTV
ncbi:ComEA family DNA-binding protein [Pseudarthrobacter sp. NPDC058362]|uniref:ComEA family DNA-binding protein n=1 Tax=Pseudarthrobacter sp. NPDC058362 TaxID=3346458 RepID=UPI0036633AB4